MYMSDFINLSILIQSHTCHRKSCLTISIKNKFPKRPDLNCCSISLTISIKNKFPKRPDLNCCSIIAIKNIRINGGLFSI